MILEKYSQFCCYDRGTHTARLHPGKGGGGGGISDRHCQKRNEETWKTGPDAEKSAHAENGIWLDNLYEICMGSPSARSKTGITRRGEVLGTFLREALKMIGIGKRGPADPGIIDHHGPSDPSICGKCA